MHHIKQELSIIEFKNQIGHLLHKLLVMIGELIFILGSKINNFFNHFLVSHQNFTQNSAGNSKIGFLESLVKKLQKLARLIQCFLGYLAKQVSRIQKSHPIRIRMCLKVEVKSPLIALWQIISDYIKSFLMTIHLSLATFNFLLYILYYSLLYKSFKFL